MDPISVGQSEGIAKLVYPSFIIQIRHSSLLLLLRLGLLGRINDSLVQPSYLLSL